MKTIRIQLLAGALTALVAGSAAAQTGPGAALSFDGVDDYFTTTLVMNFSQGATLEAWIKTTGGSGMILSDRGGSSAQSGMGLFVGSGGILQVFGSRGIANQLNFVVPGPAVNDGQWHHVAATWTGTTAANGVKLYLDGAVVGLIRRACGIDAHLAAFDDTVRKNFQNWIMARHAGNQPKFTEPQLAWFQMIRDHISTSFHLERDDLDMAPFDSMGGLGKMFQLFGDRTEPLIAELNEALAA